MSEQEANGALCPAQWSEHVAAMSSGEPLDVVIVGGGVVGAGAALDAACRGLSVGLLEAEDWAAGASGHSSKLAHGGLRYLRMLDVPLVREALRERNVLLGAAPHLVRPTRFLYPVRHRLWEGPLVRLGVGLYDQLARWSGSTLEGHRRLSRAEALALAPALRPRSLVGGVVYSDAQVDDARLVLALVRTAVARRALAASRAEVVGLLRERGRVAGVRVRLAETGAEVSVRSRAVVLAAGVRKAELEASLGLGRPAGIVPSKGVHLVVRGEAITSSVALIVPAGRSVLFVLPWGRHWLVGTTDTPWPHDRSRPVATKADVDYLLDQANAVLASRLRREDVVAVYAGLRALVARDGRETTRLSREHAVARPLPGLVSVSGGKLTTYRLMAEEAIDAAMEAGGMAPKASVTRTLRLLGAPGEGTGAGAPPREAPGLGAGMLARLSSRYGSLASEVLDLVAESPTYGLDLPGAPGYLRGEVVHAVSHEGARHLDDVLVRRTGVAIETADRGVHAANEVAALMAGPLGWSAQEVRREVERYRASVRVDRAAEEVAGDEEAAALMASSGRALGLR